MNIALGEDEQRSLREAKEAQRLQDASHSKSMAPRLSRIEALRTEFRTLRHILESAQIFFLAKETGEEEDGEETFLEDL